MVRNKQSDKETVNSKSRKACKLYGMKAELIWMSRNDPQTGKNGIIPCRRGDTKVWNDATTPTRSVLRRCTWTQSEANAQEYRTKDRYQRHFRRPTSQETAARSAHCLQLQTPWLSDAVAGSCWCEYMPRGHTPVTHSPTPITRNYYT